jgi:DNA invertase Pin-like site-specific DNA recombinase
MQLVGYARVSSPDQNISMQIDALEKAGCEAIYTDDGISGAKQNRPGLKKALKALKPGDTLIVWKIDRMARSLLHLLTIAADFEKRGIQLRSLTEPIDTTTPAGRAFYQMTAVFAELQRSLIRENQKACIAAAKKRGRHLGRPRKLNPQQKAHAAELLKAGKPPAEVAELLSVHRTTLYRALAE